MISGGGPPNGAPAGAAPPGTTLVNGSITSLSKTSVTVKTKQGTKMVVMSSSSQFIVNGKPAPKPALRVGQQVRIMAVKVKGALRARLIMIGH